MEALQQKRTCPPKTGWVFRQKNPSPSHRWPRMTGTDIDGLKQAFYERIAIGWLLENTVRGTWAGGLVYSVYMYFDVYLDPWKFELQISGFPGLLLVVEGLKFQTRGGFR